MSKLFKCNMSDELLCMPDDCNHVQQHEWFSVCEQDRCIRHHINVKCIEVPQ